MTNEQLENFRIAIDRIDNEILGLLTERAKIVKQVGVLKAKGNSGKSIIRPGREATMIRKIAGRLNGDFPREALAQIWRLIISSAINIEEKTKISTLARPGNRECFWLTREYFGTFTPITPHPTNNEVFQDILSGKATIGVLELWDKESSRPWWSHSINEKKKPKIFAILPFLRTAPSERTPLVIIGYVDPEPTGDDESYWVINSPENIGLVYIEKCLHKAGLKYNIQDSCRVFDNPTSRHYLLQMPEFVGEDDKKIQIFLKSVNEMNKLIVPISAHYLGSYAKPIYFNEIKNDNR